MANHSAEDIPALMNGNGTPITTSTTNTEVRDIPLPSHVSNVVIDTPLLSKTAPATNTTDITKITSQPALNPTDGTDSDGTICVSDPDTASVVNRITTPPGSDVAEGSADIPVSNTADVVSTTLVTSASDKTLSSVASTSEPSSDLITIDSTPLRIKTEIMDVEFNTNEVGKNLTEHIDWFLDQVKDGYKECEVHKMDMLEQNLVCLSCQKLMCALCLRDFHFGHDIISISKLRECRNARNILEEDVSKLQLIQQTFRTEFDDRQDLKKQVEHSAVALLKNVDTAFDQLLTIVEEKKQEIRKHICDFEKQNVSELCKELERIKAIEQEATLMIRRVMVFFTKFDIVEARVLPSLLSDMISKCKEFRVDRRPGEHKEKFLPEKKFSNILPSLLAVTNICKTIHPEATKVVWSKITPERRNGESETPTKPVSEDTKDSSIFLAQLASCSEDTRTQSYEDTDTSSEFEMPISKSRKTTPVQKRNTGRGKGITKKRKEKDRSVSPGCSPTKSSKKPKVMTQPSATSSISTLSNSSTSTSSATISSSPAIISTSPTITTAAVVSSVSSLPVITSVMSLAEKTKSTTRKSINSGVSLSGLFDIDFKNTSRENDQNLKHQGPTTNNKKVMAVVPSVNKSFDTGNSVAKPYGRRSVERSRLSDSSLISLGSTTSVSSTVTTSTPSTRADSQTVASVTSSSRATTVTSPSTTDTETGAETPVAGTASNREPSGSNEEEFPTGEDGFPILSFVNFYPQSMIQGRTVMVRAHHGKIWLGFVSNTSSLKVNNYFSGTVVFWSIWS
ncbi:uncharacterized protein LOC117342137 isoform X3 [Pecten maximus]|uniref:uncharacterized protein LOC117342137 isoform X3 n=1 Tax=Pecten maximus TaxID=6579 RepID=UPI001458F4EA|nr:uncharacterized protein LOC117342137 isoform X3 [Pecten maximus]